MKAKLRTPDHAYQVHPADSGEPVRPEEQSQINRQANGGFSLAGGRSALAQVHQSEQPSANECADALRNHGAAGARSENHRSGASQNEGGGSRNRASADVIDSKELVSLIDSASGEFAYAAQSFSDLTVLFEAIIAATESHTHAHRLAKLGERLSEEFDAAFMDTCATYNGHAQRYRGALRLVEREAS